MPVLNISEDEKTILVTALAHERVRLMGEWKKCADDYESSAYWRARDCAEIDEDVDAVTDLRRKIEVAADITKSAWHNEHGWLTKSFFKSDRGKAAYEAALQTVQDNVTGPGLTPDEARDQISPGTWTTLPEDYDDDWMFYVTDQADDKIVIASADTQTDGTKVCVVEIDINGVTRTVCAPETTLRNFERDLDRLQEMCRAYL